MALITSDCDALTSVRGRGELVAQPGVLLHHRVGVGGGLELGVQTVDRADIPKLLICRHPL